MPKRTINYRLAVVLLIAASLLVLGVYHLWRWQRYRTAAYELARGNQAYQEYKWSSATFHFGRYLALAGDDIDVMLHQAHAYLNTRPLKRSYIERAIAAYREILRKDPGNHKAVTKLVSIYFELDMPAEAEFILRRCVNVDESVQFKKMLAIALARQRRIDEAVEKFKEIVRHNPQQIEIFELLAELVERHPDDFAPAKPDFWLDKAISNNPDSAAAYVARGLYYLRSASKERALADFTAAQDRDLSDPYVRLRLAQGFIRASEFEQAARLLEIVQNAIPHNLSLWQSWAKLALASESKERMLMVAQQSLVELAYQPLDFMPIAAELYIEAGRSDLAGELISQLYQKEIEPATVEYLKGLMAGQQGCSYEAVGFWQRSIELGGNPAKCRLKIAAMLAELGDELSAIKQLRILVADEPGLVKARLNLARLLVGAARLNEAAEHSRAAKLAEPDNLDAELLFVYIRIQQYARKKLKNDHPDWQELQQRLDELGRKWPDNTAVWEMKVRLAMQRSEWRRAKQLLEQTDGRQQRPVEMDLAEAQLLIVLGRANEAVELLNNTVRNNPGAVEPVRLLAALAAEKGNLEQCEKLLTVALERVQSVQDRRELILLASALYARTGESQKRSGLISSCLEKSGSDICLIRELIDMALASGHIQEAQSLVERIRNIEGDNGWQWRYEQAKTWFNMERFDIWHPRIVSILKENLSANPDDQSSRILLAQTYECAGQLKLAALTCKDALGRSVGDVRIGAPAVAILYHAGEYDYADRIVQEMASQRAWSAELKIIEFRSFLQRGQFDSAVDILKDILAMSDISQHDLTEESWRVGLRLADEGVYEALLLCNEMVEKFGNAQAYIIRARLYIELGRPDKAAEDFEQAGLLEPDNIEICVAKARFYHSIGHIDKAVNDAQRALALAGEDATVSRDVVAILLSSTDAQVRAKGKVILSELLLLYPEDLQLLLCEARHLISEGQNQSIDKAEVILERITRQWTESAQPWALLAEISLKRGDTTRAMQEIMEGLSREHENKLLLQLKSRVEANNSIVLAIPTLQLLCELYPSDASAVINLADAYLQTDQPSRAVEILQDYSQNVKARRGQRQVDIKTAVAFHKEGKTGLASEMLTQLCVGNDSDADVILARVQLLIDEQNWDRLSRSVQDWQRKFPQDRDTVVTIAGKLIDTHDKHAEQMARQLLEQIVDNEPQYIEAMCLLAEQFYISGLFSEASKLYRRIIAAVPDDMTAVNNLCWILCEYDKQYSLALELTEEGLEKNPNCSELIDTQGMIYYRLGENEKAAENFRKSLAVSQAGSRVALFSYIHLGKALARLGHNRDAVDNLNRALQLHEYLGALNSNDIVEIQNLIRDISGGV